MTWYDLEPLGILSLYNWSFVNWRGWSEFFVYYSLFHVAC